uniref:Pseudouridine synthase n=1 Tax=Candidatus Kentrum sp. MB TaxID=2138164 RepID=A0A451BDJ5_9GAMM|nr:MAG: 23S rRNA pseudouridine955/2504/2580 synthase [Candidatus Kentron sp. MB]VFK35798.1 MAG: 23S rRNA pseudouridine955/2504/2580 synthase [Candidatus Kentron sp. MB]VFK76364.1 MAG: 23S rRNA pseudouridine955/2504/2580 synthase [Candidatus Kentron sp. MB]
MPKPSSLPSPPVQTISIDERNVDQRIDNFLIAHLKGVPRTHIYRILRRGEVRANKGRVRPDYRLQMGDVVRIPPVRHAQRTDPLPTSAREVSQLQDAILFEAPGLLVLDKPAGMAVHGGSGQRYGVIEALRALRPNAPYLELAHRLDRETSGCLIIAKKRSMLRRLQEGLRQHQLDKRYLLLVQGRWRGKGRRVEIALEKNILRSGERMVRPSDTGKSSVTHFQPIVVSRQASLLEARTITGRTHQIRVHATASGHPVAGDEKYGERKFNREMRRYGLDRLFLHASSLDFPFEGEQANLHARAPLPQELAQLLRNLGMEESRLAPLLTRAEGRE